MADNVDRKEILIADEVCMFIAPESEMADFIRRITIEVETEYREDNEPLLGVAYGPEGVNLPEE